MRRLFGRINSAYENMWARAVARDKHGNTFCDLLVTGFVCLSLIGLPIYCCLSYPTENQTDATELRKLLDKYSNANVNK